MILEIAHGKQIIITNDPRSDSTWVEIWANRGSLGLALDDSQMLDLIAALMKVRRKKG